MRTRRLAVVAAALAITAVASIALAVYSDSAPVGANSFSTAVLQPPTLLAGTPGCTAPLTAKITLAWTATTSTFATGYEVYRSLTNGGPYSLIATVSGRTTTSYEDLNRPVNTTYYYALKSVAQNWRSVYSGQATATTPLVCV